MNGRLASPSYALAWVGLSRVRYWQANIGLVPAQEGQQLARDGVERALTLDPNLPEANIQMGRIRRQVDFDWAGADSFIQRAIALEPGVPENIGQAAFMAQLFGRFDEARNSDQTLHFSLTSPAVNYRAIVLDAHGNLVPETKVYRELREQIRSGFWTTGRDILVELKPHGIQDDGIEISCYFDLSKPGQYAVQLERDSPQEIGTGITVSNQVKITIEE